LERRRGQTGVGNLWGPKSVANCTRLRLSTGTHLRGGGFTRVLTLRGMRVMRAQLPRCACLVRAAAAVQDVAREGLGGIGPTLNSHDELSTQSPNSWSNFCGGVEVVPDMHTPSSKVPLECSEVPSCAN
jgi:hypothetical protein